MIQFITSGDAFFPSSATVNISLELFATVVILKLLRYFQIKKPKPGTFKTSPQSAKKIKELTFFSNKNRVSAVTKLQFHAHLSSTCTAIIVHSPLTK